MAKKRINLTVSLYALALLLLALAIGTYLYKNQQCSPTEEQEKVMGSQGWLIWQGKTLKSFDHTGRRMCVPEGWYAVGATDRGDDWAKFERGKTGVVIRKSAFASRIIKPTGTSYKVEVIYPRSTSTTTRNRYISIVTNAFTRVAPIFGDSEAQEAKTHEVLVTAGLAGNTMEIDTCVYPSPTAKASYLIRSQDQARAEELLIHAIVHLYNRHQTGSTITLKDQDPFSKTDLQETEATWAEIAFMPSNKNRKERLAYLYNVHTAFRTNNFSLIEKPPFDDRQLFETTRQTIFLPKGSSYTDQQYGHYILAPLSMVAIDGLLVQHNTGVSVKEILIQLHTKKDETFFGALSKILPPLEMKRIDMWMHGNATIPEGLISAGAEVYSK